MTVPILNRRDLDFMLHEWLDIGDLFSRPDYADHSRETIDAMLDLATRIAADKYLPHFKQSDRTEPTLDDDGVHVLPAVRDAVRATAEAGLFSAGFTAALGGMDLPATAFWASMGILQAANVSTSGFMMLTSGNARLIATFGTEAQIAAFAAPQIAGDWCGTMCLSEPRPDPRSPISSPAPNRTARTNSARATACAATRCGSPAATTTPRPISSTWSWPKCPARTAAPSPAPAAFRCSSCRNSCRTSAAATISSSPG